MNFPVIVLGSGASAAYGVPGMQGLKDHLLSVIAPTTLHPSLVDSWNEFATILKSTDLESALQKTQLRSHLKDRIIEETWVLIEQHDRHIFEDVIAGKIKFALTRLLRHLFTSTHSTAQIVTTNYDLLAEYACEAGELHHFRGFSFGRLQHWQGQPLELMQAGTRARTVEIWKVHGSLDWFMTKDKLPVGIAVNPASPRIDMLPLIVTPGLDKYRETHLDPFRSILARADTALANARTYLCIGYGFNDEHIQPKLVARCERDGVEITVLSRSLTTAAKDFLLSGKCKSFLAIEESPGGSRVYTPSSPTGAEIKGVSLWQLEAFLNEIL